MLVTETETDIGLIELRQWCIEQALKWPVDFNAHTNQPIPVDIISRATAIYKWVNAC